MSDAERPRRLPPSPSSPLTLATPDVPAAPAVLLDQLRAVVEGVRDYAIVMLDPGGTIVGWSAGAADTFGHGEAEAVGRAFDLIWTREDVAAGGPARELATAWAQGVVEDDRWHLRADGRRIYVRGTTRPVRDAGGGLTGFVKVCRDETSREAAAEALSRAAAIVESSDDAIVSKSLDGVIRTWNPAAERLFGYAAAEVVGRHIDILFPQDRLDEEPRILKRIRAGERVEHFETVRLHKDGTPVEVSVTISPVRDATGRVIGASKIARDITDRRRAAAFMRAGEARLANVVSSSLDCVIGMDHRGVITGWNPAAERTFGYAQAEAVGRALADLIVPPALRDQHRQGLARFLSTGEGPVLNRRLELAAVRRDGSEFPVELTITVTAPSGPPEFTGFVRDISELKRGEAAREELLAAERSARAEAERQGRLKDDFLATLSHELRTPLNAIVGWTQILMGAGGTADPDDLTEGLAVIDRNARAQTRIIEDILDMSRIISGKLRLDVQRIDLPALVRAGVETVRPAADNKDIRLQVTLDPAAGPIAGDPNRLNQVLWNLMSNAVKFTPKGGRVQVLLERVNSHVEISVTDTGEGIDPAFLPHVFDRFRQADASTTREHGGLGLGLSIVKQLVEMHGGSARVKSPGKGRGATFSVELPLVVVDPGGTEGTERPREHPEAEVPLDAQRLACDELEGVTVVAVDDEPDSRAIVKRLLEDCGAKVRTAGSAAEAMGLIRTEVPTVLVSDIGMPGEDGYALIRRVRSLPPDQGGRINAVALTAYARSADRVRAMEAGFQMHLAKPVEPAELIVTVATLARLAGSIVPQRRGER